MNPHKKETRFLHYLDETYYQRKRWYDTDFWVEAGGLALIICTISLGTTNHCNAGFRLIDENNKPLLPYRAKTNKRNPAHFTAELNPFSAENLSPITFHVIVNCKWVKLQILPDDTLRGALGAAFINRTVGTYHNTPAPDRPWSHKTISTMTAIPLLPHYQGGANTVFSYPQSRSQTPKNEGTPRSGYQKSGHITKSLGPS